MRITNKTIFTLGVFLILIVIFLSLIRTTKKRDETRYAMTTKDLSPDAFIDYDYTEVPTDVIRRTMRKDPKSVALVDVRSIGKFAQKHIVGSTNLPIDTLLSGNVAPHYDADMVVIVFDELSADRLSKAAKLFEKQNDYVVVLSGGITAWEETGAPMISAGDPNSIVDVAKVTFITQEDLLALITEKDTDNRRRYLIIDVRPRAEFKRDHIAHAINIPLTDLEHLYTSIPATKRLIVYGATIVESFRAGVQLYDLNFFATETLDGGFIDWVRSNKPTVNNPGD